jgi:hypothetical protein
LTAGQIDELNAGLWYVNVTTGNYPDGEIRGQILSVPEPSTWALFGLGAMVYSLKRAKGRRFD